MAPNHRQWSDYKIAVVCAMLKERIAVEAMLDERHEMLHNRELDDNNYTFGCIGPHNIVITSLGTGNQGNACAASVAAMLKEMKYCLLVGIAGGIPRGTEADIRLGDIVVGAPQRRGDPAVVDFQAGWAQGESHKIVQPRSRPPDALLKCIDGLEARYLSQGPLYLRHLAEMLQREEYTDQYNADHDYRMPSTPDYLFISEHPDERQGCEACAYNGVAMRPPRKRSKRMPCKAAFIRPHGDDHYDYPLIHFGTIASSEAVVKSASKRQEIYDSIFKELEANALCLEMEAAGVLRAGVDCLVIRGICDYADSHKNKQWQNFAAAAAAAWMKDLLLNLTPVLQVTSTLAQLTLEPGVVGAQNSTIVDEQTQSRAPPVCSSATATDAKVPQSMTELLEILRYPNMNTRRGNIDDPIHGTCVWILEQGDYHIWSTDSAHQLLWILGHPGAGKSTIMKFLDLKVETDKVSFYFNGRGVGDEKTTHGMFRSVLYQLLQALPSAWQQVDKHIRREAGYSGAYEWTSRNIMDLIKCSIRTLQGSLHIFIDALDECANDDVQIMIDWLRDLVSERPSIKVCFASRYYPAVTIDDALHIQLDKQRTDDLAKYVKQRLSRLSDTLQQRLIRKANGIFIWVVLVAQLLQKDISRGNTHQIDLTIDTLPTKLSSLFEEITARSLSEDDHGQFQACMLWLLFSSQHWPVLQPLTQIMDAIVNKRPGPACHFAIDPDEAAAVRYIANVSRGLAEVDAEGNVQVIHESVRDFFLLQGGLRLLFPQIGKSLNLEDWAHDCLKQGIYVLSIRAKDHTLQDSTCDLRRTEMQCAYAHGLYEMLQDFVYTELVLSHASTAAATISQDKFLLNLNVGFAQDALDFWLDDPYDMVEGQPLYIDTHKQIIQDDLLSEAGSAWIYACIAASSGDIIIKAAALHSRLRAIRPVVPLLLLAWAIYGHGNTVLALLQSGVDINACGPDGQSYWCCLVEGIFFANQDVEVVHERACLSQVLQSSADLSLDISRLLVILLATNERWALISADIKRIRPAAASLVQTQQYSELLKVREAGILQSDHLAQAPDMRDAKNRQGQTALMITCREAHVCWPGEGKRMFELLLQSGADVLSADGLGWTALMHLMRGIDRYRGFVGGFVGQDGISRLLLAGCDPTHRAADDKTAFALAEERGQAYAEWFQDEVGLVQRFQQERPLQGDAASQSRFDEYKLWCEHYQTEGDSDEVQEDEV